MADPDDRFFCNVTINGRCACRCLIDTGANVTLLPLSAAQQAGVSLEIDSRGLTHISRGVLRVREGRASLSFMSGITIRDVDVRAIDESKPYGIIGMNVLQRFRRIEFDGDFMTLEAW